MGCGHGIPQKRSTVGEGDPPASNPQQANYDLLTLDQLDDAVCPAANNAIADPSPDYASPDANDDGEL